MRGKASRFEKPTNPDLSAKDSPQLLMKHRQRIVKGIRSEIFEEMDAIRNLVYSIDVPAQVGDVLASMQKCRCMIEKLIPHKDGLPVYTKEQLNTPCTTPRPKFQMPNWLKEQEKLLADLPRNPPRKTQRDTTYTLLYEKKKKSPVLSPAKSPGELDRCQELFAECRKVRPGRKRLFKKVDLEQQKTMTHFVQPGKMTTSSPKVKR